MKKLVVLFICTAIICFAAVFLSAQNNTNNVAATVMQMEESGTQCSLFFRQTLNAKDKDLEHFKDNVEYFLETGFFWEGCLKTQLQSGQNVMLNYIGYTQNVQPSKAELKNLIKSAMEFKEELEDYIEEQEPKTALLHWAERYIALQAEPALMSDKTTKKILNRENKKFDAASTAAKIFINIKTEQDQQNTGAVLVSVNS